MNYFKNFSLKVIALLFAICYFLFAGYASAASLSTNPNAGTFSVGSTFDVSIFLNTEDESINVIEASLNFPPDKLQLVSQSVGRSVIGVWTSQPRFNNATGRIDLQGGVPGGLNVSGGLITTLSFRVKSVGQAVLKFLDNTKILLNDGLGTNALKQATNGIYNLILPPPAGPIVVSETHPSQSTWYPNSNVILRWAPDESAQAYSYTLSADPVEISDDISDGAKTSVVYKNVPDGTRYFHIKSLRSGVWGGTTHFALNIDTAPPAEFPLEFVPFKRTVRRQPIIQFETTDTHSGLDHYELKMVNLRPGPENDQPLFIEVQSPYIPVPLEIGNYDVILRAYDRAGNFREAVERLEITTAIFRFIKEEGLEVRSRLVIPWVWVLVLFGSILVILIYLALIFSRRHNLVHLQKLNKELPGNIQNQLEELKAYRKKYGKALILLLFLSSLMVGNLAKAQGIELSPPLITTVSREISNEEIFYVGGKTDAPGAKVIIYLQSLQNGETLSQNVDSDRRGEWFYRHPNFLTPGNYLLWSQTKIGDELSPPSPQIQMNVRPTAISFGSSRLSYESIYLILLVIFFAAIIGLVAFIIYHGNQAKKKRRQLLREVQEAEESIRRGFAILRRDIQEELAIVKKAKLNQYLSAEEKEKEATLLRDLNSIEERIGKEVWDIEHLEPER